MSLILAAALLLAACSAPPAPKAVEQPRPDPTAEASYRQMVDQLGAINREAESLLRSGKFERAAEEVGKGQALESELLAAPRPTLEAMQASSDLDDLYGRMLLRNRHYDWAESIFQKNVIRWKVWKPQTEDTAKRLKAARDALAECERQSTK